MVIEPFDCDRANELLEFRSRLAAAEGTAKRLSKDELKGSGEMLFRFTTRYAHDSNPTP